jgi:hypothetical protein
VLFFPTFSSSPIVVFVLLSCFFLLFCVMLLNYFVLLLCLQCSPTFTCHVVIFVHYTTSFRYLTFTCALHSFIWVLYIHPLCCSRALHCSSCSPCSWLCVLCLLDTIPLHFTIGEGVWSCYACEAIVSYCNKFSFFFITLIKVNKSVFEHLRSQRRSNPHTLLLYL